MFKFKFRVCDLAIYREHNILDMILDVTWNNYQEGADAWNRIWPALESIEFVARCVCSDCDKQRSRKIWVEDNLMRGQNNVHV